MDYIKKVFNDENNMYVSFPSTDDNIICKNQAEKTLAADASVLFIVKDNNLYELF